ncbi:putative phospholipid-transporting ATPase 8 [Vitis vinifera]|uniref:Putative phospholipid-transporting ATPase 8 n=1 Tax=Vitis vinifera TaxID=29760 RepID=A0A438EFY9_VITVI|nr:putative phospholipid-transporting ATPase 8 [Vitis vinifera]
MKSLLKYAFFICMQICYFFYKNIAFGFTLFWFEAYASFSGQPAYNDWYMSFYNVFFTSLPVIALGVFDQDVSARLCLKALPLQLNDQHPRPINSHQQGICQLNLNLTSI